MISPPHNDARNTNSGPQIKDPSSSKQVHFINVVTIKPVDEVKEVEVDRDNKMIEVKEVEDKENYFDKLPTKEE